LRKNYEEKRFFSKNTEGSVYFCWIYLFTFNLFFYDMKLITLLIFCLFTMTINAQNLTKSQAFNFAKELYKIDILSEKGRDTLMEIIKEKKFPTGGITMLPNGQFGPSYENNIKLSYVLKFVAQAFGSEFYFRSDINDEADKIQEEVFKDVDMSKLSPEEFEKLNDELQKRKATLEGHLIENVITDEDVLPKDFSFSLNPMSFSTGANLERCISLKKSAKGKTRTKTLKDLLKIGLITQRIYDETWPKIQTNELYLEVKVLDYLVQRTNYYEDFDGNKKRELALLNNLENNKIISKNSHKNLLKTYKPYEIKTKFDYLVYCNDAIVVDLKQYSLNPEVYYPLIFNKIKSILPEFNYTNLSIKITENDKYDKTLIEQKVSIRFELNGRIYKNTFWHNFVKKTPDSLDKKEEIAPIREDFHKGINKWLADINSTKRLYFANSAFQEQAGQPWLSDNFIGLILLDEKQFKAWGDYTPYFMQMQSHDNTFNTEGVQNIIREYEKIGLVNHLSKTEIDSAKMKIEETEIDNYASILSFFPKNIVYFDWESGNLENPYEEITLDFAAASRGIFTPTNITDNFKKDWKNKATQYGFTFKNKRYEAELEIKTDWLDPKFEQLIEQALKEQDAETAIYSCVSNGQESGYVLLNKSQYDYLKKFHPKFFEKN
jgi:hypothetical protein